MRDIPRSYLVAGAIVIAGIALLWVFVFQRNAVYPLPKYRLPLPQVLLAALCMAAYQLLFFYGVAKTGVAVGTIVGIGSSPVIAGLLGLLFRGERPGWKWGAATLLAIAGCVLLGLSGSTSSTEVQRMHVDPLGLLMAIGAGAAYATFSLVSKGLLEHQPVEKVMAPVFSLGAVMLAPLLLTQDLHWLASLPGLAVMLWLGLFATALAYTLFGKGLSLVPLATAVTLSLAEPLTAGMLGVLVLGENLTLLAGIGITLILSGLIVLSVKAPSFSIKLYKNKQCK